MENTVRGVITVLGRDRVGIIARICVFLAAREINILDISQNIVGGMFNMLMIVDVTQVPHESFTAVVRETEALGNEMGLEIKFRHGDVFDAMHRI
jgi:ACT domain-containing protein